MMRVLLIRNEFELEDLIERLNEPAELIARDFALMTIAARLTSQYPDSLCFKGGFVLRHVHGHHRFSEDVDATRVEPPKHKLDAVTIAEEIERAGSGLISLKPGEPATDSGRSLDFDKIAFSAPIAEGHVSVEISYREDVHDPQIEMVGPPYFQSFPITVLSLDEIVAEKLRALCQRTRPTDLADIAMVLARNEHDSEHIRELAREKFKLVKDGDYHARILGRIQDMRAEYKTVIKAVAPDAMEYDAAAALVAATLRGLLP